MTMKKILIIICILTAFFPAGCNNQADFYVEGEEEASEVSKMEHPENQNSIEETQDTKEEAWYVHVCGAVNQPGVYELPAGSRVFEAVLAAGGLTEEADSSSVNQALQLVDGQMIYIKEQGEVTEFSETIDVGPADQKVNINTADAQELMSLSGIGQAKADAIIAYREANSGFGTIEDIMKIEGIKEGVFSKIKDSIKVN